MDEQPFNEIVPLPEGGPWTYVALDDQRSVPGHFIASSPDIRLEIEFDADQRKGLVRSLEVRTSTTGGDHITWADLRHIRVDTLARQAVAGAAQHVAEGKVGGRDLVASIAKRTRRQSEADAYFYKRFTGKVIKKSRGRLDDQTLSRVADIYKEAIANGEPPTDAVWRRFAISRSTAGRWVSEARKRNLLPPTRRGQARA